MGAGETSPSPWPAGVIASPCRARTGGSRSAAQEQRERGAGGRGAVLPGCFECGGSEAALYGGHGTPTTHAPSDACRAPSRGGRESARVLRLKLNPLLLQEKGIT